MGFIILILLLWRFESKNKYDKKDSFLYIYTNIYIHLNINDIFKAWWKKDLILGWWNLFQECPKSQKKKIIDEKNPLGAENIKAKILSSRPNSIPSTLI
jgi:hypothetical protein